MESKSKVLVVGGTGYMGRRIVRASLAQDHPTYVLQRPEIGLDIEKLQMLLSFKKSGAHLIEASFEDFQSLVDAVRLADVVICTISTDNHNILKQLKLVEAIKEAGNVKRFLPSEFGIDPLRVEHAVEPVKELFDELLAVRKAIEDAKIPFTYVTANLFAGYFIGNLCQLGSLLSPRDKVFIYGDGNTKAIFMDEDDVATYTIKTIDDPRTLNKTLYLWPKDNTFSQRQLIKMWEDLTGKELKKITISEQELLAPMKDVDVVHAEQIGVGYYYHIFYEGCLTNFEIGEEGEEASKLYPEVNYTRMDQYLRAFL